MIRDQSKLQIVVQGGRYFGEANLRRWRFGAYGPPYRPTLYLTPPAKLSRERPTSISTPAVSTAKLPSFRPPSPTQTSPTLPQSYTAVSSSSFVLLDQRLALAAAPLLHLTAARVIANPIVWANRLAAACSKNLEGQVGNFGWGKMVVYL